jgi:selenocysteine lyase/cysteine desulfurase
MPQSENLIARIRDCVIGERRTIETPFGSRPLVYADYVASGRALSFIEDAVREVVLPLYANTHTETSHTGAQTTALRNAARETIRAAVGADPEHAVVFAGAGATAAVDKLVRAMGLYRASSKGRPTVFVGPYEHHSNDLPWREAEVDIVRIPLCPDGRVCYATLEAALAEAGSAPMRIGVFSAASNVTGIMTDIRRIARMLHAHDALFFCDFAAGAPYMPIHLAESEPGANDRIDAAFISPHKFIGGPGASGLLIADRSLLRGRAPSVAGGGTVSYVTRTHHAFVDDPERREEAGTPNVVGDIRAGLVLRLKWIVGAQLIEEREAAMLERALAAWRAIFEIELLGPADAPRFCVFAFNIRHGDRYLHHNFVVALLNDLFGIQARGGCSCAGPYGHELLCINDTLAAAHETAVARGVAAMRPGWARLGLNFFFDDESIEYIIKAVRFVARNGWKFLRYYQLDPKSGTWRNTLSQLAPEPIDLDAVLMRRRSPEAVSCSLADVMRDAERLIGTTPTVPTTPVRLDPQSEALRWFWLPHEIEDKRECVA